MFVIRYVLDDDKPFWYTIDNFLPYTEFELKVRDKRGYIISDNDVPIGIMRYNMFWDNTPMLTLIEINEPYRRKGFGKQALLHWENEMREVGQNVVIISTMINEEAHHFYRKLGYKDAGGLFFHNNMPFERPLELFMTKLL